MRQLSGFGICLLLAAAALGGCGGDDGAGDHGEPLGALGQPERELNVIAPSEDLLGPPAGPGPSVAAFERRTGCRVSSTVASSPPRVARLLATGAYDGVLARGDVSGRLMGDGLVSPLNTDLVPSYEDVFPALKGESYDTLDGVAFGVPQGRLANLLMARPAVLPDKREEQPSTDLLFDPELALRYAGRITAPADPMYIAEAALYLREHEEGLEIEDPYELDREQFEAAIELLSAQRPYVGAYWTRPGRNVEAFVAGGAVAGTAGQRALEQVLASGRRVDFVLPKEGATGLVDSWMLSSDAAHPNCMYLWMDHVISPGVNAAVAESAGFAPANERACDLTRDPAHCDVYRAADDELFGEVTYWATPLADCGDGGGEECVGYDEWARAYAEVIAGAR